MFTTDKSFHEKGIFYMTASIKTTNQYAKFCACMCVHFSWSSIYHFCLVCKDIYETKIRTKKKQFWPVGGLVSNGIWRLSKWKLWKWMSFLSLIGPVSDTFSPFIQDPPKTLMNCLRKKKFSNLTPPEKVSYFTVPVKGFNLFSIQRL